MLKGSELSLFKAWKCNKILQGRGGSVYIFGI